MNNPAQACESFIRAAVEGDYRAFWDRLSRESQESVAKGVLAHWQKQTVASVVQAFSDDVEGIRTAYFRAYLNTIGTEKFKTIVCNTKQTTKTNALVQVTGMSGSMSLPFVLEKEEWRVDVNFNTSNKEA